MRDIRPFGLVRSSESMRRFFAISKLLDGDLLGSISRGNGGVAKAVREMVESLTKARHAFKLTV